MKFGDRLVSLRKEKGFSQELLAEHARVSLRTIQRLEKEDVAPRADTVKRLAQALEVPFEQLNKVDSNNEIQWLVKMNSSALLMFIPTLNIFLPLYYYKKIKVPDLKMHAQRLLSFQILWTGSTILVLILIQTLQMSITGSVMIGRFSILIPVYLICILLNFLLTLRTSLHLKSGHFERIYRRMPALF
jgi:transcriptional regulator with XRE-family HTH domain